jgi:hypothetical protein
MAQEYERFADDVNCWVNSLKEAQRRR